MISLVTKVGLVFVPGAHERGPFPMEHLGLEGLIFLPPSEWLQPDVWGGEGIQGLRALPLLSTRRGLPPLDSAML